MRFLPILLVSMFLIACGSPGDGLVWSLLLEGRDPIALRVSISEDNLVAESESYESILRPGVTRRVRTAAAMTGGRMVGIAAVTYLAPEGTQVVRGTIESTRVP